MYFSSRSQLADSASEADSLNNVAKHLDCCADINSEADSVCPETLRKGPYPHENFTAGASSVLSEKIGSLLTSVQPSV